MFSHPFPFHKLPSPGSVLALKVADSLRADARRKTKSCLGIGTHAALREAMDAIKTTLDYCAKLQAHAQRHGLAADVALLGEWIEDAFWAYARLKDVAIKRDMKAQGTRPPRRHQA